ncbi:SDR family oxidoreductase [Microvirga sp. Mcv34]|uniref:SDR family oxidoreductase n=1 Tax=Microvirga sp. Mcv34 TaxID=2926016 RepID=UPI0021C9BE2D|nr:SDR family oxidoreductase [Microvirga sp. Mcv34]
MRDTTLVTGGAGDIGRALARRFLASGHRVALLDRDGSALERAARDLASDDRLACISADVTDSASIIEAVAKAEAAFGPIGILVNNAGGVIAPTLASTDEAAWLADLDLNLSGAWRCVRAVQDGMIARQKGVVINISSANATGIYGYPAYSAAKAGLEHFTRFLAVELGRYGVRANAIAPGSVRTQAWNDRVAQDPEILERVKRWYPLGEVCEPDDVAGVAAFLTTRDARMITGAVIALDGGLTVGSTTMAREFCGAEF